MASLAPRAHGRRRADVGAREKILLLQSQFPRELRYDIRGRPAIRRESSDGRRPMDGGREGGMKAAWTRLVRL